MTAGAGFKDMVALKGKPDLLALACGITPKGVEWQINKLNRAVAGPTGRTV